MGNSLRGAASTQATAEVRISKSALERMVAHARACLPEEACGLVAGRVERCDDGVVVKVIEQVYLLENIDHSTTHFSLDPADQFASVRDARERGMAVLGNWHSHPLGPSRPSEEDKRLAYDSAASYLILSLEGKEPVLHSYSIADHTVVTDEPVSVL